MDPLITHRTIRLPPPSDDDRRAHDKRLRDALNLPYLRIPLSVLRRLPAEIAEGRDLDCITARTGETHRLVEIGLQRSYSIALDIGTTNLVGLLYDNIARKDVLTLSLENPQIEHGRDILTRMHYAMRGNGEDIFRVVRNGINTLIATLCREAQINTRDIHALAAPPSRPRRGG